MKIEQIDSKQMYILTIKSAKVYFSYETPIAVDAGDGRVFITTNNWGSTTGRHINIVRRMFYSPETVSHSNLVDFINVSLIQ